MQQIPKVVLAELRSAWRYRWHALAVAWAVCLLGWLVVYLMPDVYEARARFYLDTTSALEPFVKDLSVGLDVDQQIDLVRKVVLGREALLSVASKTDLSKKADDARRAGSRPREAQERASSSLVAASSTGKMDRNFQIAYRDTDRERAVKVVRIVLDSFIEIP